MLHKSLRILGLGLLALVLASGVLVSAQEPVEITITGTASGAGFDWLATVVKPLCEAQLSDAGMPVTISPVEWVGSGDDFRQQVVLDLGVGQGGDILNLDGFWIPEFVEAGLVKPLREVAGDAVMEWDGWDQIPEGLKTILGFQGEIYGIASGTDARVIWYRADLFEQAGIDVPWTPTSWEDVLEAARTLKAAGVEWPLQLNAGTSMGEATTMQGYLMALLGAGQHIYDFETGKWIVRSQAILDTLNLYNDIYNIEELGSQRFQLAQNGRDLSFESFSQGNTAMLVEGDYFWRSIVVPGGNFGMDNRDEVVRFAPMPAEEPGMGYNGQDFVTISGGTGYSLNPNTAHPAEAWGVLACMFSQESLEGFNELQPRIRARVDVPVTGDTTMSAIATEILPLTTIRPPLPEYNRVSAEAQLMTERVVSGEMTPEAAMDAYATAVIDIVGEENTVDMMGS
ncbi:MAG: extracellular solute-binding protein [Anaerolineae bacterium]|nr:extracellular solute-binding protein [Anaerolineae bacterium]